VQSHGFLRVLLLLERSAIEAGAKAPASIEPLEDGRLLLGGALRLPLLPAGQKLHAVGHDRVLRTLAAVFCVPLAKPQAAANGDMPALGEEASAGLGLFAERRDADVDRRFFRFGPVALCQAQLADLRVAVLLHLGIPGQVPDQRDCTHRTTPSGPRGRCWFPAGNSHEAWITSLITASPPTC